MVEREAGFHMRSEAHTWQSGSKNRKLEQESPAAQPPKPLNCPECGSQRLWKDGLRYCRSNNNAPTQRWLCRNCNYRFTETNLNHSEHFNHAQTIHTKPFYRLPALPFLRRVCVTETEGSKNLAENETTRQEQAAGATKHDPATIKGKLIELAFWLSNQGYDETTVKLRPFHLKRLAELGADLWNPESVKEVLAKQPWGQGYKHNIVYSYESFLKKNGLTWERPKYKKPESLPFIPTETELDQLIASSGKQLGTFLQGLKDTGADPGELDQLKWIDINKQTRTVNLSSPVKGHNPRILTVSAEFINRLETLTKRDSEYIFNRISLNSAIFQKRKQAALKFANPRLKKISFITFRHWKGTMEYHRTKDIMHVKKLLGHKYVQNTQIYINLESAIFQTPNDEFTTRVAQNVREACELIEVGFEYVTGEYDDGGKIFRKRK